ncbi:MAG: RNA polymerase sigma factor [Sporichthyaceae bacterium]
MTVAEIPVVRHAACSDEELVALVRAGDAGAMDVLLRRHLDRVHQICRRITAHPEDAKDATQEALVALYRNLHRFDGRSAFTTWVYRVATNAALGEVRRRGRRPAPADICGAPGAESSAGELDVARRLDVDRALSAIAPEFRAAVVLRDLCDLDYPTIAVVLDIPEGTVRSRIHRGRRSLAPLLANGTEPVSSG